MDKQDFGAWVLVAEQPNTRPSFIPSELWDKWQARFDDTDSRETFAAPPDIIRDGVQFAVNNNCPEDLVFLMENLSRDGLYILATLLMR